MKRKILALVLACLMIVSLLPTSILAADLEPKCPGEDVTHTKDNCDNHPYKHVDPNCGDFGYTIYKCDGCEVYFADDIIPAEGEHSWKTIAAEVPAKCGVAGTTEKKQCEICDKVVGGDEIKALEHKYGEASISGNCETGYTKTEICELCNYLNITKVDGGATGHKWNTLPEILVEPDLGTGLAKYTCTVCSATKEVVIHPNHEHDMVEHKATDATCTEYGTIAYWSCKDCGGCFIKDDDGYYIPLPLISEGEYDIYDENKEPKKHVFERADDYELTAEYAKAHGAKSVVAPTCTEDGSAVYACSDCKKDITVVLPALEHDLYEEIMIEAGCETFGLEGVFCKRGCGLVSTTMIEPLGHTQWFTAESKFAVEVPANKSAELTYVAKQAGTYHLDWKADVDNALIYVKTALALVQLDYVTFDDQLQPVYGYTFELVAGESITFQVETWNYNADTIDMTIKYTGNSNAEWEGVEVPATCTKPGTRDWNCLNCGKEMHENLPKLNHSLETETIPATCSTPALTVTYCVYGDLCDDAKYTTHANFLDKDGKEILNKYGDPIPNEDANGEPLYINIKEVVAGTTYNAEKHDYVKESVNEATCDKDGSAVYICKYCHDRKYETLTLDHEWINDQKISSQNCTTAEIWSTKCKHCDKPGANNTVKTALGHTWKGEAGAKVVNIAPTCNAPGYTRYYCDRAGCDKCTDTDATGSYWQVKTNGVFVPKDEYTMEEAELMHGITTVDPDADDEWEKIYEGDCYIPTLWKVYCDNCEEYIVIIDERTGKGHHTNDGVYGDDEKEMTPATCTTAGVDGYYTCTVCNEKNIPIPTNSKEKLGHAMSELIPEVAATCTKDGVAAYKKCTRTGCNHIEYGEAECDIAHDHTKNCLKLDAIWHANTYIADERDMSCEKFGYKHYICPDCDEYEYIDSFVKATDHDWVVDNEKSIKVECERDGLTVYKCNHAHHDAGVAKSEVVKAPGHKNKDNEILKNSCTNKVEGDRICVACKALYPNDPSKYTIGQDHTEFYEVYVPATCSSYGYYLWACDACDQYEVTYYTEDGYGEHVPGEAVKENIIAPTYTATGSHDDVVYCTECDKELSRTHVIDAALAQVEYILTVDNAVVAGAGVADSSLIKVTISLNADDIDIWGLNFVVNYDKSKVVFENAEFLSDALTTNAMVQDHKDGTLNVIASNANPEENLNIDGQHGLINLYFRVIEDEVTEINFAISNSDIVAINTDPKVDADTVPVKGGSAGATIKTVLFLDVNGDGKINMADAQAAYAAFIAREYNVALDVNKNGIIGMDDVKAIYDFLIRAVTYESLTAKRP